MSPEDQLAVAERQVRESEARIKHQARIVAKLKDQGRSIAAHHAEWLLMQMIVALAPRQRRLERLRGAPMHDSSQTSPLVFEADLLPYLSEASLQQGDQLS